MALHFWDASWDLNPDLCPCDIHFMDWIDARGIKGKTIYHFGSGSHHLVGMRNLEAGEPNHIVAITASPGETEAFTKMAIEHPKLARSYITHFGDIYLFNGRLMPKFDVATMFHLCEFRDERNDAYGALTDEQVLRDVAAHMNPGGLIVFYEGSDGWKKTAPIVEKLAKEGLFAKVDQHQRLPVYKVL
jgi:hypothetical protein